MSTNTEELVGRRIKTLRKAQSLTLRMLSEKCGLSANAISQIERGENSATISSLEKIASALHVSIDDLFHKSSQQNIFHLKKGSGLSKNAKNLNVQSLGFGLENRQIEPFYIKLFPKSEMTEDPMSHPGQEFVYCLSGKIEFFIDNQKFILENGDSLLFDSALLHECRNTSSFNAEFLLITQSYIDPDMARQKHFEGMEAQ